MSGILLSSKKCMSNMKDSQTRTAKWKKSYTNSILYDLYEVLEEEKLIYGQWRNNDCFWDGGSKDCLRKMRALSEVVVIFCILRGTWDCTRVCTVNGTWVYWTVYLTSFYINFTSKKLLCKTLFNAGMCLVVWSCLTLCNFTDSSLPGSSVHRDFPKQEYWSGLPCLPPGDLPNSGIELRSPALQADSLPSEPCMLKYLKHTDACNLFEKPSKNKMLKRWIVGWLYNYVIKQEE